MTERQANGSSWHTKYSHIRGKQTSCPSYTPVEHREFHRPGCDRANLPLARSLSISTDIKILHDLLNQNNPRPMQPTNLCPPIPLKSPPNLNQRDPSQLSATGSNLRRR